MEKSHHVLVSGAFDDLRLQDLLFLYCAARTGKVTVYLWSDAVYRQIVGKQPVFPLAERQYLLGAVRFVQQIIVLETLGDPDHLPETAGEGATWYIRVEEYNPRKGEYCDERGIRLEVFDEEQTKIPALSQEPLVPESRNKKVIVTGSFDWLHSGHVRFFETCAGFGDLYVIVGHDENIRLLKGEGHPLFSQRERLFMVQSVRYVTRAFISSGHGWMDAAPEMDLIHPELYVVNEDGDIEEKRRFCMEHGIVYRVLKRLPKPGLPTRRSTDLRNGFSDPHR
jgi:cytidyltransferase-like protein